MVNKGVRNIKKLRSLLKNNGNFIERIIVCEDFLDKLAQNSKLVDIQEITDDENNTHDWLLFGIPMIMSSFIRRGCILEMMNGEIVVIKNI